MCFSIYISIYISSRLKICWKVHVTDLCLLQISVLSLGLTRWRDSPLQSWCEVVRGKMGEDNPVYYNGTYLLLAGLAVCAIGFLVRNCNNLTLLLTFGPHQGLLLHRHLLAEEEPQTQWGKQLGAAGHSIFSVSALRSWWDLRTVDKLWDDLCFTLNFFSLLLNLKQNKRSGQRGAASCLRDWKNQNLHI